MGMGERDLEDIVPGFVLESLMCGVSALHADENSITYANWRGGGIENVECRIRGIRQERGRGQFHWALTMVAMVAG